MESPSKPSPMVENKNNLDFFVATDTFVSLKINQENNSKYKLNKLKIEEVELLRNIINDLEQNESVIVCTRGNSNVNKIEHKKFINSMLYDYFVVGEKSHYHIQERIDKEKSLHLNGGNSLQVIKEILPLVNVELSKWNLRYDGKVEGKISDDLIQYLEDKEPYVIDAWRLFLCALLHNHGDNFFKPYSFFISLSHGPKKYKIARYYALEEEKKTGIVCVYILDKNKDNYFTADELTQKLEKFGVKWFTDSDKEIMIINGLYPQYIIGFFEIEEKRIKRFILNYWFYEQMKQNPNYDFSQGVYVDQGENLEKFMNSARKMNFRSYFFKEIAPTGKEFSSEIGKFNRKEVPQFTFK